MIRTTVVLLIGSFTCLSAQAPTARLSVRSIPQGAEVYLNNRLVGTTPLQDVAVEAGKVSIGVVYPNARAWNALQKVDTLIVHDGQSALFEAELGVPLTLVSTPAGAQVISRNQELGVTPLFWRGGLLADVELRKEGFEPATIPLAEILKGLPPVRLKPASSHRSLDPEVLSPAPSNGLTNTVPVYVSAATMIASGIIAAALKERADKEFEIYQRTFDPARRIRTERLDRQSGVAFAVMQVSFASLAYFLLLE